MAKKGFRPLIALTCTQCKKERGVTQRNYYTKRNTINTTEKVTLKKYCKVHRAVTEHVEAKVPKTINRQ